MKRGAAALVVGLLSVTACTPTVEPGPPSTPAQTSFPAVSPEPWRPEPAAGPVATDAPEYAQILADAQTAAEPEVGPVEWEPVSSAGAHDACGVVLSAVGPIGRDLADVSLEGLLDALEVALAEHGFDGFDASTATAGGEFIATADRADSVRFQLGLKGRVTLSVYVPLAVEQCPDGASA